MTRSLADMSPDEIQSAVADRYGRVATSPAEKFGFPVGRAFAEAVGYAKDLLDALPASLSDSFTGAGNPQPFVNAQPGETVLDLGCGAGLDLLLYSRAVGPRGRAIGLDLAALMLDKARRNMTDAGATNVSFLNAPAHRIPLPDASVDLVTANGIYNLSPDKDAVMRDVARVLRPGGRTVFAEIILQSEIEPGVRKDITDWFRCIGGALLEPDFLARMQRAGIKDARVLWKGRNARTGHPASVCAVITASR